MNKAKRPIKRKLEFSKVLAVIVTLLFIATWIVAWVTWFIKGAVPTEMLEFVTMPFSVVITGYFAKSGVENYTKIKGGGADDSDT